jgi:hypothetical protein
MGSRYPVPTALEAALVELFGEAARRVEIIEHSRFARLHRARATTRPDRIYVAGSGDAFVTDLALVLHEYCHVLRQWGSGRLTRTGYLLESLRRGYWLNRFEIEARDFAAAHLERFAARVAGHELRYALRAPAVRTGDGPI